MKKRNPVIVKSVPSIPIKFVTTNAMRIGDVYFVI